MSLAPLREQGAIRPPGECLMSRRAVLTTLSLSWILTGCAGSSGDGASVAVTAGSTVTPAPTATAEVPAPAATPVKAEAGAPSPCQVKGDTALLVPGPQGSKTYTLEVGKGPKAVVLLHMSETNHCDWMPFARRLAKAGAHVYLPELRSEALGKLGQSDEYDPRIDVVAMSAYARGKGARELILVGASMGGTTALTAAKEVHADRVAALSAPTIFKAMDAETAIKELDVPTLIMAASGDGAFAFAARTLADAALPGRATLQFVDSGNHGTAMLDDVGVEDKTKVADTLLAFVAGT